MKNSDLLSSESEVSPVHWKMGDLSYEEWERVGNTLMQIGNSINWWIGDWLNAGEQAFGETYAQAVEITGWNISRLQSAKWVSSRVPLANRFAELSWSHHSFAAKYPAEEQYTLLKSAVDNGLSTRDFKERLKQYDKEGLLFGGSGFSDARSPASSSSHERRHENALATPLTLEQENQEPASPKVQLCPHCGRPIE